MKHYQAIKRTLKQRPLFVVKTIGGFFAMQSRNEKHFQSAIYKIVCRYYEEEKMSVVSA